VRILFPPLGTALVAVIGKKIGRKKREEEKKDERKG
jgi:hypothetical protein